jgi:adenylate kinase family enzyme
MNERELIVVYGKPGTSEALAETVARERSAELLSTDERVRRIANLAITSAYEDDVLEYMKHARHQIEPDVAVVSGIIYEASYAADGKESIVISGYPYDPSQAHDLRQLAQDSDRTLRVIETTAPDATALEALVHNEHRHHTPDQAEQRLRYHKATISATRIALLVSGVMIPHPIDTSDSNDTLRHMANGVLREQEQRKLIV